MLVRSGTTVLDPVEEPYRALRAWTKPSMCSGMTFVLPIVEPRACPKRGTGMKTSEYLIIFGVRRWRIDRSV